MARMARVVVPHYPHHVTQRGNRRQKTFFSDDDYRSYLELISQSCRGCGTEILAYCLMPNNVHLVMVPSQEDGLRAVLGETHRQYTRSINFREGWRGHLWQERYHSFVMDEQYLLATVRYVERNPLVAGLCSAPQDWPWSSAKAHLYGQDDQLVCVKPMLLRVSNWHKYLSDTGEATDQTDAIRRHRKTGRPLGGSGFVSELESKTGRTFTRKKPGPAPQNGR